MAKLFFNVYLRNDFDCNFGRQMFKATDAEDAKEQYLAPYPKYRRREAEKRIAHIMAPVALQN